MASLKLLLPLVLVLPGALSTLTSYTGPPLPYLAARTPLGAAYLSTAGAYSSNSSYIVDTMPSLRSALQLPSPKTIYVNGTLLGNQITDNGTDIYADCQWYIDHSASPGFNFTMYMLSLNETYVAMVNAAVAANGTWEGEDAAVYRTRLGKMNGWRGQAQNGQKAWEAVEVGDGTGLVGWNEEGGDALVGVNVKLSSVDNVHVRNLRIVPPKDCFPAPETFPATWNARYDAISAVTATNIWLDGLILEDGPEDVSLEPFIDGWLIDRFDGLFDAEDGSDNITFSHNIVRNHHKSLLFGGGNKEADRDLGKMRFTIYGNHFNNSDSRNPLMRFGTFHIVNNLFASTNNKVPLFGASSNATDGEDTDTDVHPFQYHFGVYNQSSVLVSGNVFRQDGQHAEDTSRVFTYSDLMRADIPARLCVRVDDGGVGDTFNGVDVDLEEVSKGIFEYQVGLGKAVEGGLVWGCEEFGETGVEGGFVSAEEVEAYVLAQAGRAG